VRLALALPLVLLAAGCGSRNSVTGGATTSLYGKPVTLTEIQDQRISESSGIAPSPTSPEVFYTHNDSGSKAGFFKFDVNGKVLAEYRVSNAKAVDWEDMASAKLDGQSYLFFGDIGDNRGRRREIVVYRVPEPRAGQTEVEATEVYKLEYPDEPHNAEAFMVHPMSGDITVVTKAGSRESLVFTLSRPKGTGRYRLVKQGSLKLGGAIRESRLITGGAISPDGRHVVLRTYMGAYEFDAPANFHRWIDATPRYVKLNFEIQGEGITYASDGSAFITSSELSPCQISQIPIRR
jgi:hypothetical protein